MRPYKFLSVRQKKNGHYLKRLDKAYKGGPLKNVQGNPTPLDINS
jgi:hypothetical protein